jgi:FkbM family methyltransferase
MKDYSQSGEQKIILDCFGSSIGTVLDIGANDGVTFSNSRALIELGWRACLVEPAELPFAKLKELYMPDQQLPDGSLIYGTGINGVTHLLCVNAAITTADGPLDFYSSGTHLKQGDTDLLSTTRPEELARWKKSGEVFTKTTVRGITVKTLLAETGLTRADFISIDAEGVDYDILRQLDLTALSTRMVCVEVNRADQRPFDDYCASHGMRLLHRNFENAIYCR